MNEIEQLKQLKLEFEKFSIYWLKHQTKLINRLIKAEAEIETLKRRDK